MSKLIIVIVETKTIRLAYERRGIQNENAIRKFFRFETNF